MRNCILLAAWIGLAAGPALAQGPSGARSQEEVCRDLLAGALYPAALTLPGSAAYDDYRAWLCTRDFDTHNQAHWSGLPAGSLVYGVPLEPGRSFDPQVAAGWRAAQCDSEPDPALASAAAARFRDLADGAVLAAHRKCMGAAADLECQAEVQGDMAFFHARYLVANRTATVETLSVNGERVSAAGWNAGDILDQKGAHYALELGPDADELRFTLATHLDRCEAVIEKHTIRKQSNHYPRRANGARRRH